MVQALRPGGIAVLNRDDPRVMAMAGTTAARVVTYGLRSGGRRPRQRRPARLAARHAPRRCMSAGTTRDVRLRLLGRVMIYPFLAAVAVAWAEGLPLERAVAALEAMPPRAGPPAAASRCPAAPG